MDFQSLKKNRNSLTEKLQKTLEKTASGEGSSEDSRFWKLSVDKKTGLGEATIRFLPPSEGEDVPFVQIWSHGFKSPKSGKWYIENSLTTFGDKDPVSEMNRELWNSGLESNKNIARARKRKLSYYANILVIKDKANPDNDGKVFLFRYGQKIHGMIESEIKPEYDDKEPTNVFDFWDGANFRLRAKTIMVDGKPMQTYEDSEFDRPSALFKGDDEKLEALWKSQYKLQELLDKKNFKTYDELLKKLRDVLGPEANDYEMFGGNINNKTTGISHDAPVEEAPRQRSARAADIPVAAAEDDTPPWTDEPVAEASGAGSAEDYFKSMDSSLFKD